MKVEAGQELSFLDTDSDRIDYGSKEGLAVGGLQLTVWC